MLLGSGLPAYTLRRSSRARRVRLRVSTAEGLVVVLPAGARKADAETAIRAHFRWIERNMEAVALRRAELAAPPRELLPEAVDLAAFSERWPVTMRPAAQKRVRARVEGASIVVSGDVSDPVACLAALRRWRDDLAKARLPLLLEELSSAVGISYGRASVRGQRTRWASCSSTGTISLNRNLVFLPRDLVEYVILHELAHTIEPNHSPRFWALLSSLCPQVGSARARMREAGSRVPPWAEKTSSP